MPSEQCFISFVHFISSKLIRRHIGDGAGRYHGRDWLEYISGLSTYAAL